MFVYYQRNGPQVFVCSNKQRHGNTHLNVRDPTWKGLHTHKYAFSLRKQSNRLTNPHPSRPQTSLFFCGSSARVVRFRKLAVLASQIQREGTRRIYKIAVCSNGFSFSSTDFQGTYSLWRNCKCRQLCVGMVLGSVVINEFQGTYSPVFSLSLFRMLLSLSVPNALSLFLSLSFSLSLSL